MIQPAGTAIDPLWSTDQWTYIRHNIGQWQGLFVQFSPEAVWVSETPSLLTLEEDRLNQHMSLILERTPPGRPTQRTERDLGYPGAAPYICFFPTGAFSQGAMQRRPWSSFGAEFSLLVDDRRMRLVQLYNGTASGDHSLDYVTLIPENRSGKPIASLEQTARLDLETVLGTWQGERLYLPATMERPQISASCWQLERSGQELLLSANLETDGSQPTSQRLTAAAAGRWQAVDDSRQLWLLPNGVSCMVYPQLPRSEAAHLEFCWYLSSRQRQRIVRDYDTNGDWLGTSLLVETRL
ncbi:MAG: DUF3598 family protein [Leptolyngbyaceae cyanobacterium]